MNTETDVIDTTAVVVTVIPTEQLAEINATEQGLAQLRSRASELAEMGVPQTKEAYDEVHRITMVSVKVRTETDKLSKRLAAPFKEKYDAIRAEGKRIGDHAAQSEALTRPLKEQYEAEQERLRVEAEKAAAARIQARVDSLLKIGFSYINGAYHSADMTIEPIEVQALPDDEFEELYRVGSDAFNKLVEQMAEKKRLEEAEAMRIKREEIAEADRLRAERQKEAERLRVEKEQQQAEAKRLADERAKLEKEQADFRAEQERVAKEKAWAIRVNRVARLTAVGFTEAMNEYLTYINPDWWFSPEQLAALTDEQVDQAVESAVRMNEERLAKIAADEEERVANAKAKLKADKERTARLKGDKKLMKAYVKRLADVIVPTLEDNEAVEFQQSFLADLLILLNNQLSKIDAL